MWRTGVFLTCFMMVACAQDADSDTYKLPFDCDDAQDAIHPNADEVCDGIDNDCDGLVDDDDVVVYAEPWFEDLDGDGFGSDIVVGACDPPEGAVDNHDDCDDHDKDKYPGAGC